MTLYATAPALAAFDGDGQTIMECVYGTLVGMAYDKATKSTMSGEQLVSRLRTLATAEVFASMPFRCADRLGQGVDLDRFRADAAALAGKRVVLRGEGQYVMGNFFLRKSARDLSPIPVDLAGVTSDQRTMVIRRCATAGERCTVAVAGSVAQIAGQPGMTATTVLFDRY